MSRNASVPSPTNARHLWLPLLLAGLIALTGCSSSAATVTKATATPRPVATVSIPTTATPGTVPTTIPGTPAPSGISTFRSSDGVYRIDYPSAWATKPTTVKDIHVEIFATVDQANVFAVLPLTQAVSPEKYATIVSEFIGTDGLGGTDARIFPIATTTTLNGTSWTTLTATFTLQGVPESLVAYVTPHASGTYALICYAPDSTLAQVYAANFAPLAQSFAFLK